MATITDPVVRAHKREVIEKAVLRFCGDSGDGMQITGSQFTNTVALYGNDLATFPDYPAEIRAPAGTLPGVSGFQIQFSSADVFTPGDAVDVLVARTDVDPKRIGYVLARDQHVHCAAKIHDQLDVAIPFRFVLIVGPGGGTSGRQY